MKAIHVVAISLIMFGGVASAADVHGVTWVQKSVAPGTIVAIGNQNYVLVRLPLKEFTNGNRYVVEYLADVAELGPPVVFFSDVSTIHSNDTLPNPTTVSGYPAILSAQDARNYSYFGGTVFQDGLTVEASLYGSVTIKVGDTMLNLGTYFTANQQELTAIPEGMFSASPYAKWNQYVDPTSLVANFDSWVDYIRVLKIN